MGILVPGKNCGTLAHADHVSVLVDGENYFTAFKQACEQARSHILIVGWDLDYYTLLHPGVLGPFLQGLVTLHKKLNVYLLTWDYSAVYRQERGSWDSRSRPWQRRSRIHLCLDDVHPFGGSQHQKIVVVDDDIAFCGGIDLCQARWDRSAHDPSDMDRIFHAGDPYDPFHDVQIAVSGDAAAALGQVARERWFLASGKRLKQKRLNGPWPLATPDFEDVSVGVARTLPAFERRPEVREIQQLYLDAIAQAQRFIYFENQYLTSGTIAQALEDSLSQETGPEIVIVGPAEPTGWLEQHTMGALRANVVAKLRKADVHGRLRLYYPTIDGRSLNLHSKVMIVDDTFLRVGSSNISNRSLGLDSECDIALEADAGKIRSRLLSEHLGTPIPAGMPLFAAIDAHNSGTRRLERVPDPEPQVLTSLLSTEMFFDSERPAASARAVDVLLRGDNNSVDRRPFMYATALLVLLVLVSLAWHYTPLSRWLAPDRVAHAVDFLRAQPLAPVWLIGAFTIASVALIPVTLLLIQTSILLGAKMGIAVAFGGVALGTTIGFFLGRVASKRLLIRLAGSHWRRLEYLFRRNAVLSVAIVRAFPIAPFAVINVMGGASKCSYPAFIGGTLLGMAPGILALSFFGRSVYDLIVAPNWRDVVIVVAVILFVFGSGLLLRGRLHARDAADRG